MKKKNWTCLFVACTLALVMLFSGCPGNGGGNTGGGNEPPINGGDAERIANAMYRCGTKEDADLNADGILTDFSVVTDAGVVQQAFVYFPIALDPTTDEAVLTAKCKFTVDAVGKIGAGFVVLDDALKVVGWNLATPQQKLRSLAAENGSEVGNGWTTSSFSAEAKDKATAGTEYMVRATLSDGKLTFEYLDATGENVLAIKDNTYDKYHLATSKLYLAIGGSEGSKTSEGQWYDINVKVGDISESITKISNSPDQSVMATEVQSVEVNKGKTVEVPYIAKDKEGKDGTFAFAFENPAIAEAVIDSENKVVKITGLVSGNTTLTLTNDANKTKKAVVEVIVLDYNEEDPYESLDVYPANSAAAAYADGEFRITFANAPVLQENGSIKIYDAEGTIVDEIYFADEKDTIFDSTLRNLKDQMVRVEGNSVFFVTHADKLEAGKEYYVAISNGAIVAKVGEVDFTGLTNVKENSKWKFTIRETPVLGATITVDNSETSTSDFRSVQAALRALKNSNDEVTINVAKGTYYELLYYKGDAKIAIKGQGTEKYGADVVFSYANGNSINGGNRPRCQFEIEGSASVFMQNICMVNTYSRAKYPGDAQAECIGFDSTGTFAAYNCSFKSHQDTLRTVSKSWFYDCYIEGDTDFIWAEATSKVALYEKCIIKSVYDEHAKQHTSYIFAPRTNETYPVGKGIVLFNSVIEVAEGQETYLARTPWNSGCFNQVAIINTDIATGTIADSWYYGTPCTDEDVSKSIVGWKHYGVTKAGEAFAAPADCAGVTLTDEDVAAEFAGRRNILNRNYDKASSEYIYDAISPWDIDAFITKHSLTVVEDTSKAIADGETVNETVVYDFATDVTTIEDLTVSGFTQNKEKYALGKAGSTLSFDVTGNCYIRVNYCYKAAGTITAGTQSAVAFETNSGSTSNIETKEVTNYSGAVTVTIATTGETYLTSIEIEYDETIEAPDYTVTAQAFANAKVELDLNGITTATQTTTATASNGGEVTITYESDNENVAKIDAATGEVTAVLMGTAKITAKAKSGDVEADPVSYTIIVKDTADVTSSYVIDFRTGNLFKTYMDTLDFGKIKINPGSSNAYAHNGNQHGAEFKSGNSIELKLPGNCTIKIAKCKYNKTATLPSVKVGDVDLVSDATATGDVCYDTDDTSTMDYDYTGEAATAVISFEALYYVAAIEVVQDSVTYAEAKEYDFTTGYNTYTAYTTVVNGFQMSGGSFHGNTYGWNMKNGNSLKLTVSGNCTITFLGSKHSSLYMICDTAEVGTVNPSEAIPTKVTTDLVDTYVFTYTGDETTLTFTAVQNAGAGNDVYLPKVTLAYTD